MKRLVCVLLIVFSMVFMSSPSKAMSVMGNKKAIVLASFGTTYVQALKDLLNIQRQVQKAFPHTKVCLAFTSNIIRKIWHKRQHNPKYTRNREIPKEILYVKGPLATIADLQDEGYRTIVVQPTHIYAGEEYMDLCSYVAGLNAIKTIKKKYMPFIKLVIGRPLLGKWGPRYPYREDIEKAAKAVAGDVKLAMKKHAALVYMGHGNEYFSTGAYIELQQTMRRLYPKVKVFVGTVEGFPSLEDVVHALLHSGIKRVVLKPFMDVAGDHARNDMAGSGPDSWKSVLESKGIKVYPVIKGLGSNDNIARIFVQHIKDVARDNHISLR